MKWRGCVVIMAAAFLGCAETPESPNPGGATGAKATMAPPSMVSPSMVPPIKKREEAERDLWIVLQSAANQRAALSEKCSGAAVSAYDFQCDLRSPTFKSHLAQIKNLVNFVKGTLNDDFRLEMRLAEPGDVAMDVRLDVVGLVDALPYPKPAAALLRDFEALQERFHMKPEGAMDGNRVLCFTRAMTAAEAIRPRITEALMPVKAIVSEHPTTITCKTESEKLGSGYRGVRYTSVVFIRLPSYEIAAWMQNKIRADATIGADEVRLVKDGIHG